MMAITSVGYGGTINEVQMATTAGFFAAEYGVLGVNAWKVSAAAGMDRGVAIAPGDGYGHFVTVTSDTQVVLQGAPVTSGSRWDTVVMRRDWQPPAGESTFVLVQGSASQTIAAGRLNTPGVEDDQPIALVRFTAGQTAPTQIIDLRCWSGNAGLLAGSELALGYLQRLGTRVAIGSNVWSRVLDDQGSATWRLESTGDTVGISTNANGAATIQHGLGRTPTKVSLTVVRPPSGVGPGFETVARLADVMLWNRDTSAIEVRVRRIDTGAWFGGQGVTISWRAE